MGWGHPPSGSCPVASRTCVSGGARGRTRRRDIGTTLPELLRQIVAELPGDQSTMLRVGMTNPPFILEHLEAIADLLSSPCVFSYLHVPVQSGSDAILLKMNREYTGEESCL